MIDLNNIETGLDEEYHFLTIIKSVDSALLYEKRISMDIIDYMRNYIDELVSEDKRIVFFLYVSYCSINYIKAIVKTIKDLDQPIKLNIRVLPILEILNTMEEDINRIEDESEEGIKAQTILDLDGRECDVASEVDKTKNLVKKFEVLNDFVRVLFE